MVDIKGAQCLCRFGENLDPEVLTRAQEAVADADLFITVGTSSSVYPAAGFVSQVPAGAFLVFTFLNLASILLLPAFCTENYSQSACCRIQRIECRAKQWQEVRGRMLLQAAARGVPCADVNLEPSGATSLCDFRFQGPAGEILPGLLGVPVA